MHSLNVHVCQCIRNCEYVLWIQFQMWKMSTNGKWKGVSSFIQDEVVVCRIRFQGIYACITSFTFVTAQFSTFVTSCLVWRFLFFLFIRYEAETVLHSHFSTSTILLQCHSENITFSLMLILNVGVAKTWCDVMLAFWHFPENMLASKGLKFSWGEMGNIIQNVKNTWARPWENVSYVICEQQRRRLACASVQSDQHLCCSQLR